MAADTDIKASRKFPGRIDSIIFRGKTALLQSRRTVDDLVLRRVIRHRRANELAAAPVIASSATTLWTETEPEERFLVAGKIHNLRQAVRALDGLEIPAGEVFSFWKQIGRTSRLKGYVAGRELREGCVIPNIGGGLCQISNALYDAALKAGLTIIERHAHTQIVAGSLAETGRDATVFWNYVDLRLRSEHGLRIEASLDDKELTIVFRGSTLTPSTPQKIRRAALHNHASRSCATCEMGDCHRVVEKPVDREFGKTAYLVDEFSPEFDAYVQDRRARKDVLFAPLDGKRLGKANYAWTSSGFESFHQSLIVTAVRSYRSRKLSAQGSARQLNLLAMHKKLAESYARRLRFDALHIVVHQNLLPFLWNGGHLGGRTFDVLMTALPMSEIQQRLDLAHTLHPESTTLGDFRADPSLLDAETAALRQARKIITPHTDIAALFGARAELIDWHIPPAEKRKMTANVKPVIVYPAATVGRKGCYELREALRGFGAKLVLLGPQIEGEDFWRGFDTEQGGDWLQNADLVVLPAYVEHRPRYLLLAAAQGIPVIASAACGMGNVAGIKSIDAGDVPALRETIARYITAVGGLSVQPEAS